MIMRNHQKLQLYIGVSAVLLCLVIEFVYRPFIVANHINDYGIAASGVSFLGTIAAYTIIQFKQNQKHEFVGILATTFGACMYEFLQPLLKSGTFSWLDIAACLIAGFILLIAQYFYIAKRSTL